jgi:hypothetical protein
VARAKRTRLVRSFNLLVLEGEAAIRGFEAISCDVRSRGSTNGQLYSSLPMLFVCFLASS